MPKKKKPFVYYKIAFGKKAKDRIFKNLNTAYDKGVVKSFEMKSIGKSKDGNKIWEVKITQRNPRPKKRKKGKKKKSQKKIAKEFFRPL